MIRHSRFGLVVVTSSRNLLEHSFYSGRMQAPDSDEQMLAQIADV